MAHQLSPIIDGEYLEPTEIVRRLRVEFDFVEADPDAGTEHVADMLQQFQRMNAPPHIIEMHRAMLGNAIQIVVSDREDFDEDYITFTAMPNCELFVGYASSQHEASAAPLLERTCKILRYRATLL